MESFDNVKNMAGSHSTHSMEAFGVENYLKHDHSYKKEEAALWGRGDFKTLVKNSMKGYGNENRRTGKVDKKRKKGSKNKNRKDG